MGLTISDTLKLGLTRNERTYEHFLDFLTNHLENQLVNALNKLGAALFSLSGKSETQLFTEFDELETKYISKMENLLQFHEKQLEIIRQQKSSYEALGNTGGIAGYFEFESTGKLLPILKGWKLEKSGDKCPILDSYFDEQEDVDIPLFGKTENGEVYDIGMDTLDDIGRPGKVVGLKWDKVRVIKYDF